MPGSSSTPRSATTTRAKQRYYKLFNMDGKLYYSFKARSRTSASSRSKAPTLDPEQIAWLEKELKDSSENWKIPYFHHPPYSSGERHGSDARLREVLEPLFLKYNVWWSSPGTITSTSARSRRRASSIS